MQAAPAPRLTGGAIASILLHGGLIFALFFLRGTPPPPSPPVFRVQMLAAPAGPRQIGVVQAPPETPAPEAPAPAPKAAPKPTPVAPPPAAPTPVAPTPVVPRERVPAAKPKPTPAPKTATPTEPKKPAEAPPSKANTSQPTAGGGPTGGRGADVATISTPGIEFPYRYYTDNIVRRLIMQFGTSDTRFVAEVRFIIKRDGTVDPSSIQLVTRSGNYSFDQKALGAVEAVANAKLFGPLPDGYREDILPVNFRFSPNSFR